MTQCQVGSSLDPGGKTSEIGVNFSFVKSTVSVNFLVLISVI